MFCFYIQFLLLSKIIEGESQFYQPESDEVYCAPAIYEIIQKKQILIFDVTNNDNYQYELCLHNRIQQQSILVVNDAIEIKLNSTKFPFADFSPTIIIVVNDLSLDILNNSKLNFMFRSLRSFVFIILKTTNETFKCSEGVFSEEIKSEIQNFLNVLWRKYNMFIVILELPLVCPHFFAIYKGKKETNESLYNRTITFVPTTDPKMIYKLLKQDEKTLIQGYPLRLNIYPRFPTSIETCENIHYYSKLNLTLTRNMCGMDAFIMADILTYFKFNATYPVMDESNNIYGYVEHNKTVTGSLANLIENKFDISFNSRFMAKYLDEDEVKYLHHIALDSICAIMRVPQHIPLWHYPFGSFDPIVYACLLLIITFVGVVAKFITTIKKQFGLETTNLDFINYLSSGFFGCMIKPMKASISPLRGLCLIISVIFLSVFQGHVNYVYTTMVRGTQMKTIKDLLKYNVQIYTKPPIVNLIGGFENVPLSPSQFYYDGYYNLSDLLTHDNWATLQRKQDVTLETFVGNYTDDKGTPLLYIVEQCFSNYYVTYITRKDFPFAKDLTLLITRLVEAGLPEIYYRWTKNSLHLKAKLKYTAQEPRPFTPTTLEEQRIAFSFLLIGYIVSTMVFIVEHLWARKLKSARIDRGVTVHSPKNDLQSTS